LATGTCLVEDARSPPQTVPPWAEQPGYGLQNNHFCHCTPASSYNRRLGGLRGWLRFYFWFWTWHKKGF